VATALGKTWPVAEAEEKVRAAAEPGEYNLSKLGSRINEKRYE
jgi:hypothetical protein